MPTLQQVFELSERPSLSAFAGMTIMISLYQRWLQHTTHAAAEPTYPFWENHYRLDKAIGHCQTGLLSRHLEGERAASDPISLVLRMSLAAVEISLHETAFVRARRDDLPTGIAAEAMSRFTLAANDVVEAVQLGHALPAGSRARETFRQVDRFLLWPMTTALHVFSRVLRLDELDVAPYLGSLRVLSGAMRSLVDPVHVDPRVLRDADAKVAEAERSTRRAGAKGDVALWRRNGRD